MILAFNIACLNNLVLQIMYVLVEEWHNLKSTIHVALVSCSNI